MGCYLDDERCFVWNTDAYYKLADYLKKNEDKLITLYLWRIYVKYKEYI